MEGVSEDPSRLGESMRRRTRGGSIVTYRSARCTRALLLTDKAGRSAVWFNCRAGLQSHALASFPRALH
jgi:hypothetical protein